MTFTNFSWVLAFFLRKFRVFKRFVHETVISLSAISVKSYMPYYPKIGWKLTIIFSYLIIFYLFSITFDVNFFYIINSLLILAFFHLGVITFKWNYAFLIVLEDVHTPVSVTTSQSLLAINENSYPDQVLTIKFVSFIWVSSSVFYLLLVKTFRSTKLYNFTQIFLWLY